MNHPLVSIIIPAYNAQHFLMETVASALGQSYSNVEVIIVNDGSTDATASLFPSFEKEGVRCFSIKNSGASAARNYGVAQAEGEYIQFLDGDDILDTFKIALQMEKLIAGDAQISFAQWLHFETEIPKKGAYKFRNVPIPEIASGKELLRSFGLLNYFVPVFSWLTHKSLIEKAGSWDVNIGNNDDGEYFTRVLFQAQKVTCIPSILGYYRALPTDSLSKLNSKDKIDSAYRSYKIIEEFLKKEDTEDILSYPKRLYYMQYLQIKDDYPALAKRAAKAFDALQADMFLSKQKKRWKLIQSFGLYRGEQLYHFLEKPFERLRKMRSSN